MLGGRLNRTKAGQRRGGMRAVLALHQLGFHPGSSSHSRLPAALLESARSRMSLVSKRHAVSRIRTRDWPRDWDTRNRSARAVPACRAARDRSEFGSGFRSTRKQKGKRRVMLYVEIPPATSHTVYRIRQPNVCSSAVAQRVVMMLQKVESETGSASPDILFAIDPLLVQAIRSAAVQPLKRICSVCGPKRGTAFELLARSTSGQRTVASARALMKSRRLRRPSEMFGQACSVESR